MNTPSHVAASLLIWRRATTWREVTAIVVGAILPDANMFLFYGYQKFVGATETSIWGDLYFRDQWQYFFDVFNSFPIALILLLIAWRLKAHWLQLLLMSAMLHMICDLPLHHDDGHRHFLPISGWRFESPISYWDPKRYGLIVAPIELVGSLLSLIFIWRSGSPQTKKVAKAMLWIYAIGLAAVVAYFMT